MLFNLTLITWISGLLKGIWFISFNITVFLFEMRYGYASQIIDMMIDLTSVIMIGLDGLIMTLVDIKRQLNNSN